MRSDEYPEFHPQTILRDWGNGDAFRIGDAITGVFCSGATGSGKTSGVAKHLAYGYLAADFGAVILCAKPEERAQWQRWAAECGRTDDLIIINADGQWRFNPIEWEASRTDDGGALAINVTALLDELAGAIAGSGGRADGGKGDSKFWEDALHQLNMNVVSLAMLAGLRISLPLLRSIVASAPQSLEQLADPHWQDNSTCASVLREADQATEHANAEVRADSEECRAYFQHEWPALAEKTRSIISLSFAMLVQPLVTTPLRRLFCSDTNIKPEDTFDGKIIIVDLPVSYRLAGRIANLIWKYCMQLAVMRRPQPPDGSYLRPVTLWADEAQNFVTKFDAEFAAVARSAGGAIVYLTQNRESFRRVLTNDDAVDSLLGNLQAKFFAQNCGETNEWAARLLGERWVAINSTNVGLSRNEGSQLAVDGSVSSGVQRGPQLRRFIEPARLTTLKRGGALNDYQVETIVYLGGKTFEGPNGETLPYRLLTFNQR